MKLAVLGKNISYSKSPLIHNYWLKKYGIKGEYGVLDWEPKQLERVKNLKEEGYLGLNVTIPYKQTILKYIHTLDGVGNYIQAINTLKFNSNTIQSTNTDYSGFLELLVFHNISKHKAIIIGAGGASLAIKQALIDYGMKNILFLVRNLCQKGACFGQDYLYKDSIHLKDATFLVNTTPLGSKGYPDLEINYFFLHPKAVVMDMVYSPLKTSFLKKAQHHGLNVITGLEILLIQARHAFYYWFDIYPEITQELLILLTST